MSREIRVHGPVDPEHFLGRVTSGLDELLATGERVGYCARPIRLTGLDPKVFGYPSWGTQPSVRDFRQGLFYKRCNSRRVNVCRSCSALYKYDARALIRRGLALDELHQSPRLASFFTLTAPGFGSVHRATKDGNVCNRDRGTCHHGRPRGCALSHDRSDELVGQALCEECYDYDGSVIFNAMSGKLWQRSTIYLRRNLAKIANVTVRELNEHVRISYVKVIEFQRRGVVHLHGILRLDELDESKKISLSGNDLLAAMELTFSTVYLHYELDGGLYKLAWGEQRDIRLIDPQSVKKVTNYLAKYATKSATDTFGLDHKVRSIEEIHQAKCNPHLKRLALRAFALGRDPAFGVLRLDRWAHDLGHRGHFLTKSRHFSVTFAYLREIRRAWRREHVSPEASSSPLGPLYWAGSGWPYPIDAQIILAVYDERERSRELAALEVGEEVNKDG
ncbi:MAG: replication initiator [Ferrimicrobium sp.]